jgi:hypothetical protein
LIFVIIAVIYALGGILKKAKDRRIILEDEEGIERPVPGRQKRQQQRRSESRRVKTPQKRWFVSGEEDVKRPRHVLAAAKPKASKPVKTKPPALEPSVSILDVGLKEAEKLLGETIAAPEPSNKKKQYITVELPVHLQDPDELRRAILHYEILGRPISLREPLQ